MKSTASGNRRVRLLFVIACVALIQARAWAQLETYSVNGAGTVVESNTGGEVSWEGGVAQAGSNTLIVRTSASATSLAGGDNVNFGGGLGLASYQNVRFLLDPDWVGQVGYVTITGNYVGSASSSAVTQFGFTAFNYGMGQAGIDFPGYAGYVQTGEGEFRVEESLTGSVAMDVPLFAGQLFSIAANARSYASVNYYGMGGSSGAAASAEVSFSIHLTEDRLHWASSDTVIQAGAPSQWAESLELTASRYAVFNDAAGRSLSLGLGQSQEWRGLVVDGESLALDLSGHTLTLGFAGESVKTYSILIGEGRGTASTLTLKNGTASLDYDIVAGRATNTPGQLILDQGAVVNQKTDDIRALFGVEGEGTLTVRGASQLQVSEVALGLLGTGVGHADIRGAGTSVETTLLSVGVEGRGDLVISGGASVTTGRLGVAAREGSTGVLTVQGAGSRLTLNSLPESAVLIGAEQGSTATMEIKGGATFAANDVSISIGSGLASDSSVLNVLGTGTTMTDAGVNVRAGGSFRLGDGARWTNGGLVVRGGEARIDTNAVAALNNYVTVGGVVFLDHVLHEGSLTIGPGATLSATEQVEIKKGGTLTVSGAGAVLRDFTGMDVVGVMNVNQGGQVFAGTGALGPAEIVVHSGGQVLGSQGDIHANVVLEEGALMRPGNSPGTLTIHGNVVFNAGSSLQLEIGGLLAGTNYDRLVVEGSTTFASGSAVEFAFVNGFAPTTGQTFTFFDVSGAFDFQTATTGLTVTGLAAGWLYETALVDGGFTLTSLSDGVATSSSIPEPSTYAVLFGAAALGLAAWFRRQGLARV